MKKEIFIAIAIFLVALGFGFFAGMEYKAYQIRSTIADGFTSIFGAMPDEDNDREAESAPATEKTSSETLTLTREVGFKVLEKDFADKDFGDEMTFTFLLTNNTTKDISGVKGTIVFHDIFGDEITSLSYSYDKGIEANETITDARTVDYNQFSSSDEKLRNTPLDKLTYDWKVDTIVYADGSKENGV